MTCHFVSLHMTVHKIIHVTPLTYHYHAVWLIDMTVHKIIHVTPLTHHYRAVWLNSSDMSVHKLLYHAVQLISSDMSVHKLLYHAVQLISSDMSVHKLLYHAVQLISSDMSVHKILQYVIVTSLNYYHAAWFISSHITLSVQYIIMNFPFKWWALYVWDLYLGHCTTDSTVKH